MNRGRFNKLLQVILIFALMSAGVSPACKFISGQSSLIEICSSTGIKQIAIPEKDGKKHKKTADQCSFCSFAHTGKIFTGLIAAIDGALFDGHADFFAFDHQIPHRQLAVSFDARAPPRFS